jgi:hypothetical protein
VWRAGTVPLGSSARLFEIDLQPVVSAGVLSEFSLELWKRAERREGLVNTALVQQELEDKLAVERADERRLARDEEERRIREFFNLADQQHRPPPASARSAQESPPGSFAAVVATGGFFPALPPPALSGASAGQSEAFSLHPNMASRGAQAWGKASPDKPRPTHSASAPSGSGASFAEAVAAKPKGKPKALFSNNPENRRR